MNHKWGIKYHGMYNEAFTELTPLDIGTGKFEYYMLDNIEGWGEIRLSQMPNNQWEDRAHSLVVTYLGEDVHYCDKCRRPVTDDGWTCPEYPNCEEMEEIECQNGA